MDEVVEIQDMQIVDLHCDMLSAARAQGRSIAVESSVGHADIPRLERGGVDLVLCALFARPCDPEDMFHEVLSQIADFRDAVKQCGPKFLPVESVDDLDRINKGTVGGMLMLEGADSLRRNLDNLERLYRLGVRGVTLTWNGRNEVADGCRVLGKIRGLTDFGKDVVCTIQELGMMVDVSHISEKGFWDVVDIVKGPIIASHSNVKRLCEHPRNLTDEQLHGIKMTDGVVGITFVPEFVSKDAASLEHVVDHIDYVCEEIGVRHVAIGSDFDGIDNMPFGLSDVTKFSSLVRELTRRGYDWDSIRKIMGENALRVLSRVLR